jgi:transcription antitermination factor NusG
LSLRFRIFFDPSLPLDMRQRAQPVLNITFSRDFEDTSDQRWYALQVRSRYEKAVANALQSKGICEFLPLYVSRRQWAHRVAEVDAPLFPGYVFCRFDPMERRVPVLTTPGVMGIVGFGGKPVPVDAGEIESIHRVLESGLAAEPWKFIASGQRVRIEHGALTGVEGYLLEAKTNHRLLLSVTLLQRSVAIQVDAAWVVPVGTRRTADAGTFAAAR